MALRSCGSQEQGPGSACVSVSELVKIQLTHAVTLKNFRNFGTQCLLLFTWETNFLCFFFLLLLQKHYHFFPRNLVYRYSIPFSMHQIPFHSIPVGAGLGLGFYKVKRNCN